MVIDTSIDGLHRAYESGNLTPEALMAYIRQRARQFEDHNIWIHLLTESEIQLWLVGLKDKDPATSPLWGIPFAIKDNIDLAGIPTTAACKEFAFTPEKSAFAVQRMIDAGAIPVGKTNLDQFATGLNGTRSPWGPCANSFDPSFVSGGSSAGSAVSVALGMATFSLGTDTAGSGRVPAGFNNLVGLKPSIGLLSASGMLPACRSLDCMSIFTYNTDDANTILACAEGFDEEDGYSRNNPFSNQTRQYGDRQGPLTIGVIPESQLAFFGDKDYEDAYTKTLSLLADDGFLFQEIDYQPFAEVAQLLYEGPWVSERYIATSPLIQEKPEAFFPVVRDIISAGGEPRATDLFKAMYRLQALKQRCERQIAALDAVLTPTAGRHFTIDEMLEEPVLHNTQLGYYTNFVNLLDFAAIAVPAQLTASGRPFGVTFFSGCFSDRALLSIAKRVQTVLPLSMGATGLTQPEFGARETVGTDTVDVLVCGAHLKGLPLNWQLTERGATLHESTTTAPVYRLYALAGGPPFRPGMILDEQSGGPIDVEVWSMPISEFGSFVAAIPEPLGIGKVQLADGRRVSGFICEPWGIEGAEEITQLGGWRPYYESLA